MVGFGFVKEAILWGRPLTQTNIMYDLRKCSSAKPSLLPHLASLSKFSSMTNQYFAYGSNMNRDQMTRRCPGSEYGSLAVLRGWAYFINGNGYAGVEERPGSETHGCIWTLRESDWFALDQYEAVSEGFYERILLEVEVGADRFKREVWVYLSIDRAYGRPSANYQRIVEEGGREIGLPSEHLRILESWAEGPPCSRDENLSG